MKISVIVPVYKVELYLRKCVDSVLGQTFRDFELILVDDGSPDNCGKMCDEYATRDARIKVIHQANGGLSAARNAGIDYVMMNSKSEYITFIDSDDWVEDTYLGRLYEGVKLGAEMSVVGIARAFDENTIVQMRPECRWKVLPVEDYWLIPDESKEGAVAKLFRKDLFKDVRFPVGKVSEEVFTTHKVVFAARNIAVRGGAYYMYLCRAGSITMKAGEEHKRDLVEAGLAQYEYIKSRGFVRAAEYSRGRACHFMLNVADAVRESDPAFAKELRGRVLAEIEKKPFEFWDNRNVYRHLRPIYYRLRWPFAMLWNVIRFGRESWLVRDLPPILRIMYVERTRAAVIRPA